jgi:hypothetical protein
MSHWPHKHNLSLTHSAPLEQSYEKGKKEKGGQHTHLFNIVKEKKV